MHTHLIIHTTYKPASRLHSSESQPTNYTAVRPYVLWWPFHNLGIEITITVLGLNVMAFPTTNRLLSFPAQSVENGGSIKVLIQEVLVTSVLQELPTDIQGWTQPKSVSRTQRRCNWEYFGAWWATCSVKALLYSNYIHRGPYRKQFPDVTQVWRPFLQIQQTLPQKRGWKHLSKRWAFISLYLHMASLGKILNSNMF